MEKDFEFSARQRPSSVELPSLLACVQSNIANFDITPSPRGETPHSNGSEITGVQNLTNVGSAPSRNSPIQAIKPHHAHTISISLPSSPSGLYGGQNSEIAMSEKAVDNVSDEHSNYHKNPHIVNLQQPKKAMFHSQPMPVGDRKVLNHLEAQPRNPRSSRLRDNRYDSFKTWSGKLERQISNLRGKPQEEEEIIDSQKPEPAPVPGVDRFFDALEGPELETLRASEQLVLPEDKKWPFLLRFPISSFGMCLGVSSQAMLYKTLATSPSTSFLHMSPKVNLVLWSISISLMAAVSFIYFLKVIFYFEAVRREYYHPIRVNFFFAPWIACLFLAIGVPPLVSENLHGSVWYVLMAPILCLELKIYGQWMSGGQRRLSKVANPSNHLSVVGNFVGALLGASMGLQEGPILFFAVGLAHYTVLFVTLYQRLPTNETLPKELHPVFFLFVAAPSVACMAWAKITGEFGYGSRIAYFIALFLYVSLAVRVNFFRGFRFSLAWWAYTFPMTGAAIATIRYSSEVKNVFTESLSVVLSCISTLTVIALLVSTVVHAFVLRDLFPNDISIAITEKRLKSSKKHVRVRAASSDAQDLEACVSGDSEGH
ncbi:S-type anion channel SLAH3 [Ananas comosus]|uniref:S-type anion channel SLAH3 n=1 Tax=Ananas comosus TaxID=4615 RepID=A0A199W6U1_ANACO|nr:S-type anion channel SLAH3 [Ananas comosus]